MKESGSVMGRLWRMRGVALPVLKAHRGLVAGCLGMSIFLTCLELLRPQPIRLLFDGLLMPNVEHLPGFIQSMGLTQWPWEWVLGLVCSAILLISGLIALMNYFLQVNLAYLGNKVVSRLRKIVFRRLLELPALFHDRKETGDLVLRLTGDIVVIRDLLVATLEKVVGRLSLILGMVLVMALMNPMLTFVALVLIPALAWTARKATTQVNLLTRKQRRQESEVAQSVHEIVGEMRIFAAYGRKDLEDERFDSTSRRSFKNAVKSQRVISRLSGTVEVALGAGTCAIVALGAREVLLDRMSAGELLVFISYLRMMFKPIRSLADTVGRTGKAVACAERVFEILETPIELTDEPDAVVAPVFEGRIEMHDVSLTYGGRTRALDGVSFTIEPGETVALTGPSGSGKSSICMLIPRLYDPDAGTVSIDGVPIRSYTLESLRAQISLVLQDSGVFNLTIAENVAFGQQEWAMEEVIQACREAELHDAIEVMPGGYQTLIGERGTMLSGGQRRRLALARALLRHPRILILDEPYEGLDGQIAQAIHRTIMALTGRRTIIIVSHHESHLTGCDRVLELRNGRLVRDSRDPAIHSALEARAHG